LEEEAPTSTAEEEDKLKEVDQMELTRHVESENNKRKRLMAVSVPTNRSLEMSAEPEANMSADKDLMPLKKVKEQSIWG